MKLYEIAVNGAKITSDYGYRIHPIDKVRKFHYGIDLTSKKKDYNLYAVADGYVQKVVTGQDKATKGFGNYIWVRYPQYNLSFIYAHCKKVNLKKGDKVKKGTIVAIMGKTGAATGVHLHLGITKIGSNTWLDPKQFTDETKYNLTRTLKSGIKGDDVKELQKELKKLGYDLGKYGPNKDGIDGVFGTNKSKTSIAIKSFQKSKGLSQDGIVGKNTAHALGWLYKGK